MCVYIYIFKKRSRGIEGRQSIFKNKDVSIAYRYSNVRRVYQAVTGRSWGLSPQHALTFLPIKTTRWLIRTVWLTNSDWPCCKWREEINHGSLRLTGSDWIRPQKRHPTNQFNGPDGAGFLCVSQLSISLFGPFFLVSMSRWQWFDLFLFCVPRHFTFNRFVYLF